MLHVTTVFLNRTAIVITVDSTNLSIMDSFSHHGTQVDNIEAVARQHLTEPDIGGVQLIYLRGEVVRVGIVANFREIL